MDHNEMMQKIDMLEQKVEALERSSTGRLREFMKRAFSKTSVLVGTAIAAVVTGVIIYAAQNVFVDGTVISAADVNNNFNELYAAKWGVNGSNLYYTGGDVGIGTDTPGSALTVQGVIESTSGGIKLPDGSVIAIGPVYAQLEKSSGQTFAQNAWTPVSWDSVAISSGISVSSTSITFTQTGIYRITVSFRAEGADVWTGMRVYGDGSCRGHSSGWGNSALISYCTTSFLVDIQNSSATYVIEIGRLASQLAVIQPSTISDETLPAIQAQIEKID